MQTNHSQDFNRLSDMALEVFTRKHESREQGLRISRQAIRLSSNAIRSAHRKEFDRAKELIKEAGEILSETKSILDRTPEIYHAGFLSEARKEYCEANITLALLSGEYLPQPEDLGVDISAYLKGLGDASGEMRRYILDSLRTDDWSQCEQIMAWMDDLYGLLVTLDFPEGVTGGLRHTTDMVRGTLERTRGDFTMALRQRSLEKKLSSWNESKEK